MSDDDFQPSLGRIRSAPGRQNQRYLNRVVQTLRQSGQSSSGKGRSSFSGSRSARGYSSGAAQQIRSFQPGRRRVIIKTRFTRFRSGGIGAARAHLRYIQRDGVTRDGEQGKLYGSETDHADGKSFLSCAEGDRHQFRFIVAPEDSAKLEDLKPFIRDLMHQAEKDMSTKLDWVAVDHFNTGHPHTHIILRGKDDLGKDLVIARDYLSRGMRERARDLITLELGPETQQELDQKIIREVQSERFTRIDRSILGDADQGILTISSSPKLNHQWQGARMGRLRKLENMGLVEELKPGVWKIADRTDTVLRKLGERGDIGKTMQRVLKEAGADRSTPDFSVFDSNKPNAKITGKIIAMGLSNELQDEHYVVVDGTDGKLHYAEVGRLSKYDPPSKDMVITIKGNYPNKKQAQTRQTTARISIESHLPFDQLANAEGATWLDRKILSKKPLEFRSSGFGVEAYQALQTRRQWLLSEKLMTEQNDQLVARRKLLGTLERLEVNCVAQKLQKELGLSYQSTTGEDWFNGQIIRTAKLASGRFAVIQRGKEFAFVPWRLVIQLRKTTGVGLHISKEISRSL